MEMALSQQLEAILFWKAEPQSVKQLAKALATTEEAIRVAITELEASLMGHGLRLVTKGEDFTLSTAPEVGDLLEKLNKEELSGDLGRAGLETLTIVAYRGPVAKSEIDYIRGVNSSFTIRHLLVRGLIEKKVNPTDARSVLYGPTFELMSLLGLVKLDELPEFNEVNQKINDFLQTNQ